MTLKKRLKIVVVSILAGIFVLLSVAGLQAQGSRTKQTDTSNKGSIYAGVQHKSTAQGDTAQARITAADAAKVAEGAYPGYSTDRVGFENENGYLVYYVKMFNKSGKVLDVKVDAGNAKILAIEKFFDEDGETNDSRKESENEQANKYDTDKKQNEQQGEHEG